MPLNDFISNINPNQDTGALVTLSSQAAGTVTSGDQLNEYGRGIIVVIDISAIGASTNLTVTIQGKDNATGQYYTLLASSALSATGNTVLTVYPGCIASANTVANLPVPRTFRISAVVAGSNTCSAIIGASIIG